MKKEKRTVNHLIEETIHYLAEEGVNAFVNRSNELIFIPEINAYFRLEDVKTEEDFLTKVVAYLSYYCAENHYDDKYSPIMARYISYILRKDFTKEDLFNMYKTIANSLDWSRKFVKNNCSIKMFEKYRIYSNTKIMKVR